jgi:16S rRNA (cytidine1402-2'-O)-methyltransferase
VPLAVCATPIGTLEDVTLRVLRELAEADVVLCEDTRHTKGLLDRHGISATLVSYHRHNEARRTAELLPRLEAGAKVALVSDAGLPGVNDPGARLIVAALAAGVPVTVLPGPSAVETSLVASGLAGERYQFLGYLPRGRSRRCGRSSRLGRIPRSRSSRHSGCPGRCARSRTPRRSGRSQSAAS